MKEYTHKIRAEVLHQAAQFSAKKDVRYYLHGIHVRKSKLGLIAEASDGHTAAIILDRTGESKITDSVIICNKIIKMLPKVGDVFIHSDDSISFNNLGEKSNFVQLQFEKALIDGKFPTLPKVLPKTESMKSGLNYSAWSPAYILKALTFFSKLGCAVDGVQVFQDGKDNSAVFMNYNREKIIIVMPQRCDSDEYSVPEWVTVNE